MVRYKYFLAEAFCKVSCVSLTYFVVVVVVVVVFVGFFFPVLQIHLDFSASGAWTCMCMDPCSFKACSLLAVWMFVRGINSR